MISIIIKNVKLTKRVSSKNHKQRVILIVLYTLCYRVPIKSHGTRTHTKASVNGR